MLENNFWSSGHKKNITPSIQAVKKLSNDTEMEYERAKSGSTATIRNSLAYHSIILRLEE